MAKFVAHWADKYLQIAIAVNSKNIEKLRFHKSFAIWRLIGQAQFVKDRNSMHRINE